MQFVIENDRNWQSPGAVEGIKLKRKKQNHIKVSHKASANHSTKVLTTFCMIWFSHHSNGDGELDDLLRHLFGDRANRTANDPRTSSSNTGYNNTSNSGRSSNKKRRHRHKKYWEKKLNNKNRIIYTDFFFFFPPIFFLSIFDKQALLPIFQ